MKETIEFHCESQTIAAGYGWPVAHLRDTTVQGASQTPTLLTMEGFPLVVNMAAGKKYRVTVEEVP